MGKPQVQAKNIIFGQVYVDLSGTVTATNHTTGDRVEMEFHAKDSYKNSYLTGTGYDASGRAVLKISGSWLTAVHFKDLTTGIEETVWQESEPIHDAHLQYYFDKFGLYAN